jgi:hypothetical protein
MQLKDLLEAPIHTLSDEEVQLRISKFQQMRVTAGAKPKVKVEKEICPECSGLGDESCKCKGTGFLTKTRVKVAKKSPEEVEKELQDFLKELG